MKYKLVADTPAEQQALDSGNVALPVFDTLLPVLQARAIMAGVHLGVFEAIGHEARTADEVFITSTAGGIMPVTKIDGRAVGSGTPGPVTEKLQQGYWMLHEDPRYTFKIDYS